jgi:dienelactone hydrolase
VSDTGPQTNFAGVVWDIGHYAVQGISVSAVICRPAASGAHKAVIINHGGFGGIDDTAFGTCIGGAQNGWLTAMSAYRGETLNVSAANFPPSGITKPAYGAIELCLGEVTDVLRLTDIVRARADVDASRILMWGHSHGACVTERAVQRGAKVKAAAAFSAPTDMVGWYGYSDAGSRAALSTTFGAPGITVTPSQSTIPYDWRSPVTYKDDLTARSDVKMLLLQGAADPTIYPRQACELASAAWGASTQSWHLTGSSGATVSSSAPSDCAGYGSLTWQPGGLPYGSWSANSYLLVYDYADHGTILTGRAWTDFLNFVATVFP